MIPVLPSSICRQHEWARPCRPGTRPLAPDGNCRNLRLPSHRPKRVTLGSSFFAKPYDVAQIAEHLFNRINHI